MTNFTPILSIPKDYAESVRGRLARKSIAQQNGCLNWAGAQDRYGYGKIKLSYAGQSRQTGPHRAAWLSHVGDISDAHLEIDHLCRNILCINIDHMELVTKPENVFRAGVSTNRQSLGRNKKKIFCDIHGNSDITYYSSGKGATYRLCKTCRRDYMREYMRKRSRQK